MFKSAAIIIQSALALLLFAVATLAGPRTPEGFLIPHESRALFFPQAHGSHPEYQTEWWYFTGHLQDESGLWYGFQATFFRSAATGEPVVLGSVPFGDSHLMLAHMSFVDIDGERFYYQERLKRDGWDAWAKEGKLDVRNGNWSLLAEQFDEAGDPVLMFLEGGVRSEIGFSLELRPWEHFGRILFGPGGLSRKGDAKSSVSYYISFPRLDVEGTLRVGNREKRVTGSAWMDHEISSSLLMDNQVGWDWAAIQLEDGNSIMAFQIRLEDGGKDPNSKLVWVSPKGDTQVLTSEDFQWVSGIDKRTWTSPATGAIYPTHPRIELNHPLTGEVVVFQLEANISHAELSGDLGGVPYWEGPCLVKNASGEIIGRAYLEMTGYARSLGGQF